MISVIVKLASKHHQEGSLLEAKKLYEEALESKPNNAGILHMLGIVAMQSGNNQLAIDYMERSIKLNDKDPIYYCNLGNALTNIHKLGEAITAYNKAIELNPDNAAIYNNLANVFKLQKRFDQAITAYRKSTTLNPDCVEVYANLGLLLQEHGDLDEAIECYNTAVRLQPDNLAVYGYLGEAMTAKGDLDAAIAVYETAVKFSKNRLAYNDLGNALKSRGKFDEAINCYEFALELNPDCVGLYNNIGDALAGKGLYDEAIGYYNKALSLDPEAIGTYNNLGNSLLHKKLYDEAVVAYHKALQLDDKYADVHNNLGNVLKEQNKYDEAIACYNKAIELKPNYAEAHNNMGNALASKGLLIEASHCYRRAIELKPNYDGAYNNLGNVFLDGGLFDKACICYSKALELNPKYAEAYNNFGLTWSAQGKFQEAIDCYNKAIDLDPNYADAYWNRSLTWLQTGNFEQGWEGYEWRFQCANLDTRQRDYDQPIWDGRSLNGETVLLWSEQGLGDAIQFVRFAKNVADAGGKVIVHCAPILAKILSSCSSISKIVVDGGSLPEFDYHISLMSLPKVLGINLSNIQSEPYLSVSQDLIDQWSTRLGPKDAFRIGVTWQGNPGFKNDYYRSFDITKFDTISKIPGVRLYALQKGGGSEQPKTIGRDLPITVLSDEIRDFTDTAAIMKNMDLIICPCTSVVHLAGSIGVNVWLALSYSGDWRWLCDRNDSPWYRSLKLYRQKSWNDWSYVFDSMANDIRKLVDKV